MEEENGRGRDPYHRVEEAALTQAHQPRGRPGQLHKGPVRDSEARFVTSSDFSGKSSTSWESTVQEIVGKSFWLLLRVFTSGLNAPGK